MIGASDLNRVIARRPAQDADLVRYARAELDRADLSWATRTPVPRKPRVAGVRTWLAGHLRGASFRATAAAADRTPGLAPVDVHGPGAPSDRVHRPSEGSSLGLVTTSALILAPASPCRGSEGVCRDEA